MGQTYTDAEASAISHKDIKAARLQISGESNIPEEQVRTSVASLRVKSNTNLPAKNMSRGIQLPLR